jgi:hypothetical protein
VARPHSNSTFIPFNVGLTFFKPTAVPRQKKLKWEKTDKVEKWRNDLTQIIDRVYVGSGVVASDGELLAREGITHSVNCASQFVDSLSSLVSFDIPMLDGGDENILSYIWSTTVFIENAIAMNGKVLVHCVEGISRSVGIVIGYLILTRNIDYATAFRIVRQRRRVAAPNPKFIAQLLQLCEVIGSLSSKTCFFSKEKILPFQVVLRRGVPVAIPIYAYPEQTPEQTFLIIDFRNDSVRTLEVRVGTDSPNEVVAHAQTVAADIAGLLKISTA